MSSRSHTPVHNLEVGPSNRPPAASRSLMGDEQLAQLWNDSMEGFQLSGKRHSKVAVLIISWVGCWDETGLFREAVDRLEGAFRNWYHYKVEKKQLHAMFPAQLQLSDLLQAFINSNKHDHTLLIIAYVGHGQNYAPDRLVFSAMSSQINLENIAHPEHCRAEWHLVEEQLDNIDSDVLLILDCCHAGSIRVPRPSPPSRSFEMMAACTRSERAEGGPRGLSTALAWALIDFYRLRKPVTLKSLKEHMERRYELNDFAEQEIIVVNRGHRLAPELSLDIGVRPGIWQDADLNKDSSQPEIVLQDSFDLRFGFEMPVREEDILALSSAMKSLMEEKRIAPCKIDWVGRNRVDDGSGSGKSPENEPKSGTQSFKTQ